MLRTVSAAVAQQHTSFESGGVFVAAGAPAQSKFGSVAAKAEITNPQTPGESSDGAATETQRHSPDHRTLFRAEPSARVETARPRTAHEYRDAVDSAAKQLTALLKQLGVENAPSFTVTTTGESFAPGNERSDRRNTAATRDSQSFRLFVSLWTENSGVIESPTQSNGKARIICEIGQSFEALPLTKSALSVLALTAVGSALATRYLRDTLGGRAATPDGLWWVNGRLFFKGFDHQQYSSSLAPEAESKVTAASLNNEFFGLLLTQASEYRITETLQALAEYLSTETVTADEVDSVELQTVGVLFRLATNLCKRWGVRSPAPLVLKDSDWPTRDSAGKDKNAAESQDEALAVRI